MAEIAESEPLMKKLAKYLKKLIAQKTDPSEMTEKEFFAKIDEARDEIKQGMGIRMLPNKSLEDFLKRLHQPHPLKYYISGYSHFRL